MHQRRFFLALLLTLGAISQALAQTPTRQTDKNEFRIGPEYADAPEMKVLSDVPKGTVHEFIMDSKDSKFYPGISKERPGELVPYRRQVGVYVPVGLDPKKPAPILVVHDGMWYRGDVVRALDNLIFTKKIPPLVAILLHNGGGDSKGSQRGLEYDTVSGRYAEFIEAEVLPRVERDYSLKLTRDPTGRATMGGSSGGAAALTMAWFHPEWYRRVLCYSGTFVDQQYPQNPESLRGAWEYHASLIPKARRKPLRIWLEISENDLGANLDEASLHNWVMANERMAAVLKAKKYDYRYVFAEKAGHTDGRVTRQTLPEALIWLWQGYKAR
jgi:iron(III)-enterobactin esterase